MFKLIAQIITQLFRKNTQEQSKQNQIKQIYSLDCCILGYHNWVYVEDYRGRKPFRICDVCGAVQKEYVRNSGIYVNTSEVEKNALFNCIKRDGNKYKLNCGSYNV